MLYYYSFFTLTQSELNLRNFVANLALSRLRAFRGALLAEIWRRGTQKHFSGPGPRPPWTPPVVPLDFLGPLDVPPNLPGPPTCP